jgi:hypothetical protein
MTSHLHADIIVFAGKHGSVGGVYRQLADLGLAMHAARTPSEVLWLLEAGVPRFSAILIDGDNTSPDEIELRAYLAASYPSLRRFLMITGPDITELDGCLVVDKLRIGEQVAPLLRAHER